MGWVSQSYCIIMWRYISDGHYQKHTYIRKERYKDVILIHAIRNMGINIYVN